MLNRRAEILNWAEQGRIEPDALPAILAENGITPSRRDWLVLFEHVTLWIGTLFLALAVIYFFAYNWDSMGRFAKFGLVELCIVGSLALGWRLDLNRPEGKACLVLTTLLIGALLALVGQTYQTGADTFQLFGVWALAVLPLVLVARFAPLWMILLVLLNLTLLFYCQVFGGIFGWSFSEEGTIWLQFSLNTLALCLWESAARMGLTWLQGRAWVRVLIMACITLLTILAMEVIFSSASRHSAAITVMYPVCLLILYYFYRVRWLDLIVLASAVLSAIIVVTAILSKQLLKNHPEGELLFIATVVIILSSLGGLWLKSVSKELRT
jgi:uncharacterized membrane protein